MRLKNLVGRKFGKLTVTGRVFRPEDTTSVFWECLCSCGKTAVVRSENLLHRTRPTKSCGCSRTKFKDILGQSYGQLKVIEFVGFSRHKKAIWRCLCSCGRQVDVLAGNLGRGTQSCGCSRLLDPLYGEEGSRRNVIRSYTRAATSKGLEWNLTDEEAVYVFKSNCHYCGSPPSNHRWVAPALHRQDITKKAAYVYNGLDRIDNSRGYTPDNVVPCCRTCNFAKGPMPYVDFIEWAKRLGQHQLKQAIPRCYTGEVALDE